RVKTYKIIEQDPVVLEKSDNPFSVVILVVQLALQQKRLKREDYFNLTLDLVRKLYRKGFERKKIIQLLRFIKLYVNFDRPEINSRFDKEIDVLNNKTRTMGIIEQEMQIREEKGIKIGKEQERIEKNTAFVNKLLLDHKHSFTLQEIADLADVSIEFVL